MAESHLVGSTNGREPLSWLKMTEKFIGFQRRIICYSNINSVLFSLLLIRSTDTGWVYQCYQLGTPKSEVMSIYAYQLGGIGVVRP